MSTPVSRLLPFLLSFHSFHISIKNVKHPLKSYILLIVILPKDLELLDSNYFDNLARCIPKRINAIFDAACKILSVFYSSPLLGLPELLLQKFSYGVSSLDEIRVYLARCGRAVSSRGGNGRNIKKKRLSGEFY